MKFLPDYKKEYSPITGYLLFFGAFLLSVILCILVLSLDIFKPEPEVIDQSFSPFFQHILPQNYKMRAYPAAIIIMIFSTLFFYFLFSEAAKKSPVNAGILLLAFSGLSVIILPSVFISTVIISKNYIGTFWYIFTIDPLIYTSSHLSFFTFLMLLASCVYIFYQRIRSLLPPLLYSIINLIIPVIVIILIIITAFDRTFDEKNLFVGPLEQYIHTIPVIAPIHDILMGKAILVNADSQYGLFLPYLYVPIFKFFIPLTFTNFFYMTIAIGIIYYFFAFILLTNRLKNRVWALAGLIVMFTFHFYSSFDRYTRPLVFPLRYLFDLPFFLLLLYAGNKKNILPHFLISFLLGTAFFYNFESGGALIISYAAYLFCQILAADRSDLRKNVSNAILKISLTAVTVLTMGILYSLYAFWVTGQFPGWIDAMRYIVSFGRGFAGGILLPAVSLHLFVFAVYFIVIVKSLIKLFSKSSDGRTGWDLSLAVYGLLILYYYIKTTYILYLAVLAIPSIILTATLFKELFEVSVRKRSYPVFSLPSMIMAIPYLLFCTIFAFSTSFYIFRLIENPGHDYWKNEPMQQASSEFYDRLVYSSGALNNYEAYKNKVTLLSYYDGFIKLKAQKTNTLRLTNAQLIISFGQVDSLLTQLINVDPEYIYTDNSSFTFYHRYDFLRDQLGLERIFKYIENNYKKIDTVGILDVWQRKG